MGIEEWFKNAWENYKRNWTTYVGLTMLVIFGVVLFIGVALLSALSILQALISGGTSNGAWITLVGLFLLAFASMIAAVLLGFYVYTGMCRTALSERLSLTDALKEAKNYFATVGNTVLSYMVITALPIFLSMILMPTNLFSLLIGGLFSLYIAIRLVTAAGLAAMGRGTIESLSTAWKVPLVDSLTVWIAQLIVGLLNALVQLVPVLGVLVSTFVVLPYGVAVYMEAVKEKAGG